MCKVWWAGLVGKVYAMPIWDHFRKYVFLDDGEERSVATPRENMGHNQHLKHFEQQTKSFKLTTTIFSPSGHEGIIVRC